MIDTGCPHPDAEVVDIGVPHDDLGGRVTIATWCPICGSVKDHTADGSWRAPSGVVLPGWTCSECQTFNGAGKELLTECRHCNAAR